MTDQPQFKYGDRVRLIGSNDDKRRTIIGLVPNEGDLWAYAMHTATGGFYGVQFRPAADLELVPDVRQQTIDRFAEWWEGDGWRRCDGTGASVAVAAYDAGWIKDIEP